MVLIHQHTPVQLVYQTPMQLKMLTSLREVYGKMDAEGRELTNAWDAVQTNVRAHLLHKMHDTYSLNAAPSASPITTSHCGRRRNGTTD